MIDNRPIVRPFGRLGPPYRVNRVGLWAYWIALATVPITFLADYAIRHLGVWWTLGVPTGAFMFVDALMIVIVLNGRPVGDNAG